MDEEAGSNFKHVPEGREAKTFESILQSDQSRLDSVCNYLQSLIPTVRALADLLKQRQSVYDVHDFASKTINGYSFEESLERMSTPISSASSDEP